ncbi:MAG: C_GCAxxG_C_C family protein [Bacteroidales bacterium]|nr:C_GCAxxG_C_C family protein [Bacteroidales bacterium]
MTDKPTKSVGYFKNRFNCSQSVFATFAEDLGIDVDSALKIACGLGAGIGRMQKTCGAVTGAILALGLKYGKGLHDDESKKAKAYLMAMKFIEEFTALHKSTECLELIGHDMKTEVGMKAIDENNLFVNVCAKLVKDATTITEKLLKEQE